MGTFPFGWIREIDKDNWQLFWNSETKILYAKGAISKRFFNIGQSQSWQEAKALAAIAQNKPEVYLKTGQNK